MTAFPLLNKVIIVTGYTILLILVFYNSLLLTAYDFPVAADSFYYLIEFKSLIHDGLSYYKKATAFFVPFAYAGKYLSLDETTLLNTVIIGSLCLFSFSGAYISGSKLLAPYIAIVPWASSLFKYNATAFPRQMFALSVFAVAISILSNASKKSGYITGILMLFWSGIMHLFSFASIGLLVFQRMFFKLNKVIAALIVVFIMLIGIDILDYYTGKTTLSLMSATLELGWLKNLKFFNPPPAFKIEFILLTILWLFIVSLCMKYDCKNNFTWLFLIIWFVLNLPVWDIHSGMAGRLIYAAPVYLYLGASFFIKELPDSKKIYVLFPLIFAFSLGTLISSSEVNYLPRPYEELKKNNNILKEWIPADSLVLAPHGIQFGVTYFIDRKAVRLPPITNPDTSVFRIIDRSENSAAICTDLNKTTPSNIREISCFNLNNRWKIEMMTKEQYEDFKNQLINSWQTLIEADNNQ